MTLGLYYDFHLEPAFINQYKGRQPEWGPVGQITYKRTYARSKEDGTHEEFWETCRRVVEGAMSILLWHYKKESIQFDMVWLQDLGQRMYRKMWDFKFLPPGRGLWMMGTAALQRYGGAPLLNCAFRSTQNIQEDFAGPFTWLMDLSMLGVGVGGDCRGAGKVWIQKPVQGDDVHVVADSREGWVDLVRRYLDAYVGKGTIPQSVDYSLVRRAGVPIKTFGGTAAGPEPLRRLVVDIQKTLNPLIGKPVTTDAIVDLFNFVGKAVVSGNVRRSAEVMFSEPEDEVFLSLKDPTELDTWEAEIRELSNTLNKVNTEWVRATDLIAAAGRIEQLRGMIEEHPLRDRRWASNNSVFARVGMEYTKLAKQTATNGEPGYLWLENVRTHGRMGDPEDTRDQEVMGCNPCLEQPLFDGEGCNLVETFPARHEDLTEFLDTLEIAYLYGKIVTLLPVHHDDMNRVMQQNRRIGISMTGITEALARFGRPTFLEWCDTGYNQLRRLDEFTSTLWKIPTSIRLTSVKPSGTISLLPGATPGVHYPHSQYYVRNIRFAVESPYVTILRNAGYKCEPCSYTPYTTVVSFPVWEKNFLKSKVEVTMLEQMELVAQVQEKWADNAVSATVTFSDAEASGIGEALVQFEGRLKCISFLPNTHKFTQAPYIEITAEEYLHMTSALSPYELTEGAEVVDAYCDGDKCQMPQVATAK